jgi:tRNA dimethylallyltransferase
MGDSGEHNRASAADRIPVLVISGPTCCGKSSLAIELARHYGAEIISADSRQIFRQIKIGTDRLDPDQWHGVPHHLMGTVDLGQRFTVFDFVREAQATVHAIQSKGKRAIVCGGTGLYIRALIDGIFEIADDDMPYRNELLDLAATKGPGYLHGLLAQIDPESAREIHAHNMVRVMRALEIFHLTGRRKSELGELPSTQDERFRYRHVILMPPRERLYRRIEKRVERMIVEGLFEEAEAIYRSPYGAALKNSRIVGYAEICRFLEGGLIRDEAIRLIMQNTRRFAKRQYTWFRAVASAQTIEEFGLESLPEAKKTADSFWPAQA